MKGAQLWNGFQRYSFSVLIFLVGLFFLLAGLVKKEVATKSTINPTTGEIKILETTLFEQDFKVAIAGLIIMGFAIISVLFIAGIARNRVVFISLGLVVAPILCFTLFFKVYYQVAEPIAFYKQLKLTTKEIKMNLRDIRDAQVAFRSKYKRFAADFNELEKFIKLDSVNEVKRIGAIPDEKISKDEALALGLDDIPEFINEIQTLELKKQGFEKYQEFVRDTFKVAVFDKIFRAPKLVQYRKDNSIFTFNPDSLRYVPFSKGKTEFILNSGFVKNDSTAPALFEVIDPAPMGKDTLKIGSMVKQSINGNWD